MQGLTIYRSSAGSGKTYTLVKEYLLIALQHPLRFKNILAITFTNKATAEMKSRIISALIDLSEGKQNTLRNELQKQLPATDLTAQAKIVLTGILHHYSNFSISTIDSFFNEIVKALAHELRLSLRFEIELDQQHILNEACNKLLQQAGKDKVLTRWLIEFIRFRMDQDKGWNIKSALINTGKRLFDETEDPASFTFNEEEYRSVTGQLKTICTTFTTKMSAFSKEFFNALNSNGYTIEDFSFGKSGVAGYFKKINDPRAPADYKPGTRTLEVQNNPVKWLSKERQQEGTLVALCNNVLQPLLQKTIEYVEGSFIIYNSAEEALKLIYVRGILSRLNDELKNYRDEHNVITLSDANRIVRSSVRSSDTPLIYEKTGNFYHHYLIDEFQDTSTVQWENIHPLISEALAGNKSAMIVGDVKQSIYRWRGGNMELLLSKAEQQFTGITEVIKTIQLGVNYRSSREIVLFNNDFFSTASSVLQSVNDYSLPLLNEAYSSMHLHQEVPKDAPADGYIRVNVFNKDGDTTWQEQSLDLMVKQIRSLIASGYQFGDIAILVRNNKEGNKVAAHLYMNDIREIISADSLLINNSAQVIFIINCLRLLCEPSDRLIRKEAEWFLLNYNETSESIHDIFCNNRDAEFQKRIDAFIKKYMTRPLAPPDELITAALLFFELNRNPDAYLQRLQDVLMEYKENKPSDVKSFLQWWDDEGASKGYSVIMPEGGNSIRIMTIHKSKGLQFPIVLLPFADWDLAPKSGEIMWAESSGNAPFDAFGKWPLVTGKNLRDTVFSEAYIKSETEHLIDNLNLLYVAFTRAIGQLYITVCRNKNPKGNCISDLILASLNQLSFITASDTGYEYGIPPQKNTNRQIKVNPASYFNPSEIHLKDYPVTEWQSRMELKKEMKYSSQEIETGLILHHALYFIQEERDAPHAVDKIRSLYSLNEDETALLYEDIKRIFELCREKQWFSGKYKAKTETEFISPGGEMMRADRVLTFGSKAIVIDYKTGDESNAHHRQALAYEKLLNDCGYTETESWIVYTSANKAVRAMSNEVIR